MTDTNAVIASYANHTAAEDAVKEVQKSGFDMKKLSVVGWAPKIRNWKPPG